MIMEISKEIDTSEQLKKVLSKELEKYINNNISDEEKENAAKEFDIIIQGFLKGKIKPEDLGGIIAVRGFVYQYYVALNYMLEMVLKPDKWSCLIYELGDDITLIGDKDITFVQVKTEREDDAPHNLTQTTLTKRDKGLNSWLDKLFSNLNKIKNKIKDVGYKEEIVDGIDIHFVLATNMNYDSDKILAPYSDRDKKKHKDDKLYDEINKSVVDKSKNILNFNDYVNKDPQWCLDRFYINHCGISTYLWIKIREKLIKIINYDDHEVARRILDKLLTEILKRTSNDNVQIEDERKKFVFHRNEIVDLIEEYKQESILEVYNRIKSGVIKNHFQECFDSIQTIINQEWRNPFKERLNETLLWLKESLENIEVTDPFVYERFFNRIFFLENYKSVSMDLNDPNIKSFLIYSLKNIIFNMIFYDERSILGDTNTKFLIKSGKNFENKKHLFTIYNGKSNENFMTCTQKIIKKIDDCPITRSIKDEIFCFLVNDVEDVSMSSYFPGYSPIMNDKDKIKITHKHVKVKFYRYKKLEGFRDALKAISDRESELESLEQPFILDGWDKFILNEYRRE